MGRLEFKEGDELITTQEAAQIMGISPRTLEKWRRGARPINEQPRPIVISSRLTKYSKRDVYRWVTQQMAA